MFALLISQAMKPLVFLVICCLCPSILTCDERIGVKYPSGTLDNIDDAVKFLLLNDIEAADNCRKQGLASWNYDSNLTEHNKEIMLNAQNEGAKFNKATWENATKYNWKSFEKSSPQVYRWFKSLALLGDAALPEEKLKELNGLIADMANTYSTAKVCLSPDKCKTLEPGLSEILSKSRNSEELKKVWAGWRDKTGKVLKKSFQRYVDLRNEAATLNGFKDAGELWREVYHVENLGEDVTNAWNKIRPFYHLLHAYVRRKLSKVYPNEIKIDGPIPAHLLGNMWAQSWSNIEDIVKPYSDVPDLDITDTMKKKNVTKVKMFEIAEGFFKSLGLIEMTPEFWNNSILEKPEDRDIVCHASAWDLCNGKDVRIKMCTEVNMEDLITAHHEMGHIEYYLQYAIQKMVFRNGANPAFHEAVGDTIALSAMTPSHLKKIGFLEDDTRSNKSDINFLFSMAIEKLVFLPYGYLLDQWRWKVFNGEVKSDSYNREYWNLRLKLQGLCPPVQRSEEDLDAVAKYHIISDVPYIRYFFSHIIQFQFHKALCDEAGHKGPLHTCDIYGSKAAGQLFSDTLKKGNSVPWPEAMSIITKGATSKMEPTALLEYFQPLIEWLKVETKNEVLEWISDDPMKCP